MGTVQKCFKLDITDVSLLLTERSIYTTNLNLHFTVSFLLLLGEGSHSNLQVGRREALRERIALHARLRHSNCTVETVIYSSSFSGITEM